MTPVFGRVSQEDAVATSWTEREYHRWKACLGGTDTARLRALRDLWDHRHSDRLSPDDAQWVRRAIRELTAAYYRAVAA